MKPECLMFKKELSLPSRRARSLKGTAIFALSVLKRQRTAAKAPPIATWAIVRASATPMPSASRALLSTYLEETQNKAPSTVPALPALPTHLPSHADVLLFQENHAPKPSTPSKKGNILHQHQHQPTKSTKRMSQPTSSRLSIPILSLFLFAGLLSRTESLPTTTSPSGSAYRAGGRFRLPSASPLSWLPLPPPPPLVGTAGPSRKYPLICAGVAAVAGLLVLLVLLVLLLTPAPFSLLTRPSNEAAAVPGEEEPSCERRGTGDPVRDITSACDDEGEGRGGGVFRARPGVKAVVAARLVEPGAAAAAAEVAEAGVPDCVAVLLFARLRAGDGGVPAAVDGVPTPEALLLLLALKGLVVVLSLLFAVAGPAGDEEKNFLMSVREERAKIGREKRGQVCFRC